MKQLLQRREKPSLVSENNHKSSQLLQQESDIDFVVTNTDTLEHEDYGDNSAEDDDYSGQKQQQKQKRKEEMLERNRYL